MTNVDIRGRPGLVLELLARLFAATNDTTEPVVVLVEPSADDWDEVRAVGAPVVVMCAAPPSGSTLVAEILAGADAVLDGTATPDDVLSAVHAVAAGGTVLTPEQARLLVEHARARALVEEPTVRLTEREREVLACIDAGMSVKQTALILGIAHKTVENARSRLFRKLGARNRSHALLAAGELNLLAAES